MKKRVFLAFICLLGGIYFASAQNVPVGVIVAFKKGNALDLDKYLGEQVELVIQDKTAKVGKQSALNTMAAFFTDNKVNGFTVNHEGKRNESSFVIGTLKTVNGDYRVNCFLKWLQDRYFIHQIRIDKTYE